MTFPDISKPHANDTEFNNTESSDTYPIHSGGEAARGMAEREAYRQAVMENMDYGCIVDFHNRERLDEIVELMVDTLCSTQEYIMIGGDRKPAAVVKSQLMKLDAEHIRFVLRSMDENTTHVRNIRKYLLSVLYHAPMTISSYYSALVNHDLYGG